ncbi:MAG: hypothetical protein KDI11_03960 [Alphaproteobacteria bacterium]|nr:hypothetical protein [Alphaproteobacteria bacterium]
MFKKLREKISKTIEGLSDDAKRENPPVFKNGEVATVWANSLFAVAWAAAVATLVDRVLVNGEHHEKINAVVSSIVCESPQEEGRFFCGFGQVSATPGFLPWVGKDAENVVVVENKVQQDFNEHGLALNAYQSKQYATFPIDQGFVANDDDTEFVTVSEPDCQPMALEQ